MAIGGAALRLGSTLLYALEFCCAGIILGIYSYFMSVQADRDVTIPRWQQAVEGMAGVVVLYTIFAIVFTCFLGGKSFFALLAIIMNLLCAGAMIAIAVLTRDGASSCTGNVKTPLGNGSSSSKEGFGSNNQGNQITYSASLGSICRLNTACFAVAIVGAFLFLLSIPLAMLLNRHHKKEKRFGPGPSNGYTKGSSGRKFWQRKPRNNNLRDPEVAAVPLASGHAARGHSHDVRPSHDTAYTGSTVTAPGAGYDSAHHNKHLSGGYHTAPTGTYQAAPPVVAPTTIYPNEPIYPGPAKNYHNTPATNY